MLVFHDTSVERLRSIPWEAGAPFYLDLGDIVGLLDLPAERIVSGFLRTHRAMTASQREAVAEAIFGCALWRTRLKWHLDQTDDANIDGTRLLFAHLVVLGGQPPDQVSHWLQLQPLPDLRSSSPEKLESRFSF